MSSHEHALARLHLRAILPTLAALVSLDDESRAIIAGRSFGVRLRTRSGVATRLDIVDGTIRVDSQETGHGALDLLFLDDRQVNRIFLGSGRSLPIPTGGFRHLFHVRTFSRLAERLRRVLDTSSRTPDDARLDALGVELLVAEVLPACVAELSACDVETRRWLAPFGDVLIELGIEGGPHGWATLGEEGGTHGRGTAGRLPDVRIEFRDRCVAGAAIRGELDRMAAIGKGEVLVTGLIPLADALNRVMDRLNLLLMPTRSRRHRHA